MGNCSCFHSITNEENQLNTDRAIVELERNIVHSYENSFKVHSDNEKELVIDSLEINIGDIIELQSIIRGYLERKRNKAIPHSDYRPNRHTPAEQQQIRPRSRKGSMDSEVCRTEVKELPSDLIPDYFSSSIKLIKAKLGQFIYGEILSDEACITNLQLRWRTDRYLQGNGISRTSGMAKASRAGTMDRCTKDIGKTTRRMAEAGYSMPMEMYMKVSGAMIRHTARGFTFMQTGQCTRATGNRINNTGKE